MAALPQAFEYRQGPRLAVLASQQRVGPIARRKRIKLLFERLA
jgi:hypothetical protein